MSLSCEYEYDPEPGDVCWDWGNEFAPLATKRFRKCCSCGVRIEVGSDAMAFHRWKIPETEIEERIYGDGYDDGVPRATWFMCVSCGLICQFLLKMKYAFQINDDMRELSKEHAALAMEGHAGCL